MKVSLVKYFVEAAILVVILALFAPNVVNAQDPIADAEQALQHSSVYVAPGTEGTNNDTAGILKTRLKNDDNIVLVMLPSSVETNAGTDINAIAKSLSDKLGNQRIIGLAVGTNVVGYAPALPAGVAADQMRRAQSVSNDPVTALNTFAQNIHTWQAANPELNPPPPATSNGGGLDWVFWLIIGIPAGLVVLGIGVVAIRIAAVDNEVERTHFTAPDRVKDLLAKIAREREQVNNPQLQSVLYQLCLDIEKYFVSSSHDLKGDALKFNNYLTTVTEILTKYIDVQNNPRYYNEPDDELRRGKESITDFAKYVLESIRNGHTADLVDYKVNTQILQAQSFR